VRRAPVPAEFTNDPASITAEAVESLLEMSGQGKGITLGRDARSGSEILLRATKYGRSLEVTVGGREGGRKGRREWGRKEQIELPFETEGILCYLLLRNGLERSINLGAAFMPVVISLPPTFLPTSLGERDAAQGPGPSEH
jgi:hypothetical protein